jgi:hypothetical protein
MISSMGMAMVASVTAVGAVQAEEPTDAIALNYHLMHPGDLKTWNLHETSRSGFAPFRAQRQSSPQFSFSFRLPGISTVNIYSMQECFSGISDEEARAGAHALVASAGGPGGISCQAGTFTQRLHLAF